MRDRKDQGRGVEEPVHDHPRENAPGAAAQKREADPEGDEKRERLDEAVGEPEQEADADDRGPLAVAAEK